MDRASYHQKMDVQQMQQDLSSAVTEAQALLEAFEMEAVEKLDSKVQTLVMQASKDSESRLRKEMRQALIGFYQQEHQDIIKRFSEERDKVVAEVQQVIYSMREEQRQLKRRAQIATVWLITLTLLLIGICATYLFVLRH